MFTEASGTKSKGENLAMLPTSIRGFINDSIPLYAQWNYRILCHPTKKFLSPDRLRVVEDLASRMPSRRHKYRHLYSRGARFQINKDDSDRFKENIGTRNFLDDLMEEIPGRVLTLEISKTSKSRNFKDSYESIIFKSLRNFLGSK